MGQTESVAIIAGCGLCIFGSVQCVGEQYDVAGDAILCGINVSADGLDKVND